MGWEPERRRVWLVPTAALVLALLLASCARESRPATSPPADPADGRATADADEASSQTIGAGGGGSLGTLDVREKSGSPCVCDIERRLQLNVQSTCPTKGGITVQIHGSRDLYIEDDLPKNAWRSVSTVGSLSLPRTVRRLSIKLHALCDRPDELKERAIGAHTCVFEDNSLCL